MKLSLRQKLITSSFLQGLGLGVLIHDYLHDMYVIGGYKEILSLQGGYFGIVIFLIGWIIMFPILINKLPRRCEE